MRISRHGLRGHVSSHFRGIPSMGAEGRAERCLRREAAFFWRCPMECFSWYTRCMKSKGVLYGTDR